MPVYFGFPINYEEAFRILNLDLELATQNILDKNKNLQKDNIWSGYYYVQLEQYFKNKPIKLNIFPTDKGQFIIGYEIKEAEDVWNKFINMDEFMVLLFQLKKKFQEEMELLNADWASVKLEYMEGSVEQQIVVKNPIPYIICYD
jgi:hypothetical protein